MNIRERLFRWLDIRPGERRSTSLMLVHSFFTGTSTVFFETAASALFLAHYEAAVLPYVYLIAAVVSIVAGFGYTRAKERVAFAPLMTGTLAFLLVTTCLLRIGLSLGETGWLIFTMMIVYRLLSMLTDLEYWAVAARLYDVQQSKRLFGLVGSGEVAARVIGSFSVPLLVRSLGVENLLWLSVFGLGACLLLLASILRSFPDVGSGGGEEGAEAPVASDSRAIRSLRSNPYLKSIFLLAFFAVLGKYFVDFAFLSEMQTRWHEVENLAAFFGVFSGVTQIVNLLIRVLISGRLLNRFGILVGLLVLPSAHFLCTLAIVAVAGVPLPTAVFWLTIGNQGLYKTLKHTVDNPSFKVLYQPLPRRERLAAQIGVEVIVTPVAIALAAALMILFSHPALSAPTPFGVLMLLNFAGWGVGAVLAFRQYGRALVRALEKRTLDRTSFSLRDERSISLVRARLESERPDEVIFSLDLLQRIEHPSLDRHFEQLLEHSSPDVRFYVLLQIEKRRPPRISFAVGQVVDRDPSPRVQAVALRALAALGDPAAKVPSFVGHTDRELERGALVGLLQGPQKIAAGRARVRVLELGRSSAWEDRVLAARVLGEIDLEDIDAFRRLLADENEEVRRAAIRAAGRRRDERMVARLLDHLGDSRYRGDAGRALVDSGEKAFLQIAEAIVDTRRPLALRARVAQLASRFSSFPHGEALWNAYQSGSGRLRQAALEALGSLAHQVNPSGSARIVRAVEGEVRDAAWKLGMLRDIEGESALENLAESLREEIAESRARVFLLLSFLYDRKTVFSARDNLDSAAREKRAYAAEILEVTLSQELKELALPLIDPSCPEASLSRLARRFPQAPRRGAESLADLLGRTDESIRNWTRACAIYGASKLGGSGFTSDFARMKDDQSPLVAETARWALDLPDPVRRSNGSHRMLTIEKVLLLKGVSMFSSTSEDTLADVADVLEEVELGPGELVFSKGDPGDSMYIVVSGKVRVFDGARTINYLGEREIFGELALLDPEPRSASVEAFEETRLFRLGRDTLFELMADNVGVVSGIMQVLCRRLRRMTAIATAPGDKR
ncbi:MAG: cyclic nucleotide-binding domain-containing protein [Vicinamibacteria bacterium]